MVGSDKRKMERYELKLPATICFKKNNGSKTATIAKCKTKNVCAGGAFFYTDKPFKIDTKVDVGMRIAFHNSMNNTVLKSNVEVTGVVGRIENEGMVVKFGKKYKLTPTE